ncbi:MAG: TolC family protein [Ignavibacteria bacterium]|nr:TolC family protein [Ignavibacteria bacterium]
MKIKVLVLLMLFLPALYAQESKTVTLSDCINIAVENNKLLKVSKSKIYFAGEKLNEVQTSQLPTLKFNGSAQRLSEVDPFKIGTMQISPSILNNYSMRLTLSQPLFTGFRLASNVEVSEYNYRVVEKDYQKDKNQLIMDTKIAFFNYVKAREVKKTIEKSIEQVAVRVNDIKNLYENGLATYNDLLKVKVQLSNFEILNLDATNNISNSMYYLNTIMGLPVSTNLVVRDSVRLFIFDIPKLEDLINQSRQNRSDIKSLEFRIKSGESGIRSARSGWFPQLSFNANYLYANPNSRYFPAQNAFKGSWDIGLTLTYDLWNWRLTTYQTRQAESNVEQTKLTKEFLESTVELEVNQNYSTYKSSVERLRLTKETVEQAEENYRVTFEKYKSGLILNLEVVDAETSLLLARINYYNSMADYYISVARLEKAIETNFKY